MNVRHWIDQSCPISSSASSVSTCKSVSKNRYAPHSTTTSRAGSKNSPLNMYKYVPCGAAALLRVTFRVQRNMTMSQQRRRTIFVPHAPNQKHIIYIIHIHACTVKIPIIGRRRHHHQRGTSALTPANQKKALNFN